MFMCILIVESSHNLMETEQINQMLAFIRIEIFEVFMIFRFEFLEQFEIRLRY